MEFITKEQADVIGEIANICTGNAATTLLYALSDDPIPDIMKDLSCIRKELKFLHEVCDSLCDRVFGDDIIHLKKS